MCIIFLFVGENDTDSDYKLILATNRDEVYDRPSKHLAPWSEDPDVIGGRDLQAGCNSGTWFAFSPLRGKIGTLLNLPKTIHTLQLRSRGSLVADYIKTNESIHDYVDSKKECVKESNGFVLVSIDIRSNVEVHTYNNITEEITKYADNCLGFSNSLPDTPLKKVEVGKELINNICQRHKKYEDKNNLVKELIELLRLKDRHLPDPEIERTRPKIYKQLSSIFVSIPELRYGTRTHTVLLVTKTGKIDVIEMTMKSPVDLDNLQWDTTEQSFSLNQVIT